MTDTLYGFKKAPKLSMGSHSIPEHGMCIMELVSFINGDYETFSDTPGTVHPQIVMYMQNANDYCDADERVHLLSVLDRMFHTGDMTVEQNWDFGNLILSKGKEFTNLMNDPDWLYDFQNEYLPGIWRSFHRFASSTYPMEDKLAVLNLILDCADEAMGVTEVLPQNREVIEQMLEKLGEVK